MAAITFGLNLVQLQFSPFIRSRLLGLLSPHRISYHNSPIVTILKRTINSRPAPFVEPSLRATIIGPPTVSILTLV
ncbi:hypothetical protein QCA50_008280 [Cerrena zonata]|uniref:Uncharacterized protein n=1 Tax=Cerrena zonata TaxID=2478898 RepID=A0AAW0GGZ7_9APHY